MSSTFDTPEQALNYVRAILQIPADVTFQQIETEPIGTFGADLLIEKGEAEDTSESDRMIADSIKATMAAQTTYRAVQNDEEYLFEMRGGGKGPVHFTIGPFRSGFDCWMVCGGMANRL